jgi:hypothetical protein
MTNLPCIKLPLSFENGLLDRTSKSDSIIDFVSLILSTKRGSIPDALDFGNAIWEKDIGERAVTVKGQYTEDGETREVAVEFDFFRT